MLLLFLAAMIRQAGWYRFALYVSNMRYHIKGILQISKYYKKSFFPQQGGLTWAFNTQLYLEEYYPDFNPGIWVAMDSIVGGRFVTLFC